MAKTHRRNDDSTRFQILYTNSSRVENFTAAQRARFIARQRELSQLGVAFTTWDCRNNALSNMFRF